MARRRSQRSKRNRPGAPARPSGAGWSDLELAFFAAAPPDEPEPAAKPECFDDLELLAPGPPRWERLGALVPAVAAAFVALRRLFSD
ncbi:MAG TPA: hypothetical protein VFH73_25970 [Polyangia bacterium]|nr:hypothetical protein [Polyangia bacterium]